MIQVTSKVTAVNKHTHGQAQNNIPGVFNPKPYKFKLQHKFAGNTFTKTWV